MHGPPDPRDFVAALRPALRQAAAIARALEGRVENEPKPGETRDAKAALTIADTAAQEAILTRLFERWPHVSIEAEEDTATAERFPADGPGRVVVDPIDGTLHCYLAGRGPYAVMAGLAVEDRYQAALVALPREGILLDAAQGWGATLSVNGEHERIHLRSEGMRVLVPPELPAPILGRLEERGYEPRVGCGGAVAVAPLLPGVRAGLRLAIGTASLSTRGRIGVLIAREAGATALGADGAPFPDDLHTPAPALLVARDDDTLRDLLWALNGS